MITAIVFMAGGCGDRKNSSAPPAKATESTAVEKTSVVVTAQTDTEIAREAAKAVLDELPQLRDAAPLSVWKKFHDTDIIELYAPGLSEVEKWCARARSEMSLPPGRKWVRTAYFYVPEVAVPAVLPGISGSELIGQCRLGLLWSEIEDADADRAGALAREARESAVQSLGPGNPDVKLQWWASGFWRNRVLWRNDPLSIVTAVTNWPAWGNRQSPPAATRVFVAAAGPAVKVHFEPSTDDIRAARIARSRRVALRVDEALKIAAPGPDIERAIGMARDVLSVKDGSSQIPTIQERTAIFSTIDQLLTAARTLPPARRSAALFVADQILDQSGGPFWDKDQSPPIRKRLEAQGAQFEWLQLGGTYGYTHTWLKEAWNADPDGRAGELAFLTLMERGFETSGQCIDQHGKSFRAVIREGEDYLRRKPGSALSSDIHFLVAQAYGDIVTLAGGGGPEPNEAEYQPEASTARSKAIEHYRTALESAPDNPRVREVWSDAWRLIAGIVPPGTHFYCVYD
jgi:hypothetical protein